MNHENLRRLRNLEDRLEAVENLLGRLDAQIRARLKEEADVREGIFWGGG